MSGIVIKSLTFTGNAAVPAELHFKRGLNVLYGASNTGKSFTLKALDFMLASSRPLPEIEEREPYDRGWLSLDLPKSGPSTLMRALAGGAFELYHGSVNSRETNGSNPRRLSAKHDHTNIDNVSQYLLEELGLAGKSIAIDANGKQRSLSFRDLSRHCIVDETSIQSETSPAEGGQYQLVTPDRSIFKLLLTGTDDSAIIPVMDQKSFRTATTAKIEIIDEMISSVDEDLTANFPDANELPEQMSKLETVWMEAQSDLDIAQQSIQERHRAKLQATNGLLKVKQRIEEIDVNLGRFEQLEEIYQSDIARLVAIEEAGFLLGLNGDRPCPLCGASAESQRHAHGLDDIAMVRESARVEISKISSQSSGLRDTIQDLEAERLLQTDAANKYDRLLRVLDNELHELAPSVDLARRKVEEVQNVRDRLRHGLSLLDRKFSLVARREELATLRPASKAERPKLGVPTKTAHEFAQTVSRVLGDWQFPGARHVAFDENSYDLRIDGKARRDNGKGVRAITHACFKVALLMFCRERGLPHPGFLVLDTPLLTYRDPLHSNAGPLAPDEEELKRTSLKDHFFSHLSALGGHAQIVIVENVDLPPRIKEIAHVETFTGDPKTGRVGLFEV